MSAEPLPADCPDGWERISLLGGLFDGHVKQVPEGTTQLAIPDGEGGMEHYVHDRRDGRFVYVKTWTATHYANQERGAK